MEILTFSFVHPVGLPHSTHHPASGFPTFPPCSGLQGWWSMPWGMQPDMPESQVLHWTAWMPVQRPYHHIAQQLHLWDNIFCGICRHHMAGGLWKKWPWVGWHFLSEVTCKNCGTKSVFSIGRCCFQLKLNCKTNTGM